MHQALRTDVPRRSAPAIAHHRVSTRLDEDTLRLARGLAEASGKSLAAWLERAIRYQVQIEDGLRACDEVLAEIGPIPDEVERDAEAWVDSLGFPKLERDRDDIRYRRAAGG